MSKPNSVSIVVLIDVVNSVEGLVNLAYLIEQNRHNPDDVLRYIRMVNVTLKRDDEPYHSNSNVGDVGNHYAVRRVVRFRSKRPVQPSVNTLTPDLQRNQRPIKGTISILVDAGKVGNREYHRAGLFPRRTPRYKRFCPDRWAI